MPRVAKPWFRFYVEAIDDPKLTRHPPAVCWLWTVILALARRSPIPGLLMASERSPMTDRQIAAAARMSPAATRRALTDFCTDAMLERDTVHDAWRVVNFGPRQYESDISTERTRKHRSNGVPKTVPTSPVGTGPPLLSREQRTDTDDGYPLRQQQTVLKTPVANPPPLEAVANVLVDRRIARCRPDNPAAYRAATVPLVVAQHSAAYAEVPPDIDVSTPELAADWLEPAGVVRLAARPSPVVPVRTGCVACGGSGMVVADDGWVASRCPTCNPAGGAG